MTRTALSAPLLLALLAPSAAWAVDADGDGFDEVWDCDDSDPTINFLAQDVPGDGIDSDCNTLDGPAVDPDGDGLASGFENQFSFTDPQNPDTDGDGVSDFEECDFGASGGCNVDVNGDGIPAQLDPNEPFPQFDADGDGFSAADDCDDTDPTVFPGAVELCDGVDNDCNGIVDDNVQLTTYYVDADQDGFGDPATALQECLQPPGTSTNGDDCDDSNASINPDAVEIPSDTIDQNCDGLDFVVDDADGDGFDATDDCDDADPTTYPGAFEQCDGVDNDCNGIVDDSPVAPLWYIDDDGDGYGTGAGIFSCIQPPGTAPNSGDCDDIDPDVNPGVPEDPDNAIDDNCDGFLSSVDDDGDGFEAFEDCDDSDPTIFPGAPELCDGIDQNCDGIAEVDSDLDGLPDDCDDCPNQPGLEANAGCPDDEPGSDLDGDGWDAPDDCNDADPLIFPGAIEICEDGIDQSCDGIDADCAPDDDDDDDEDDDKDGGCTASGTGASFTAIVLPLPLLFGLVRRRR